MSEPPIKSLFRKPKTCINPQYTLPIYAKIGEKSQTHWNNSFMMDNHPQPSFYLSVKHYKNWEESFRNLTKHPHYKINNYKPHSTCNNLY